MGGEWYVCYWRRTGVVDSRAGADERLDIKAGEFSTRSSLALIAEGLPKRLEKKMGERSPERLAKPRRGKIGNLVERSCSAVIVVDRRRVVRYVNPAGATLLGLKAGDIWDAFSFPHAVPVPVTEIIPANGQNTMAEILVTETEWDGENVYLVLLRDITGHKRTHAKTGMRSQTRFEFIGNISHELRRPLQSIMGFSKLMVEGKVPDIQTQKEFLTIINKESQRLDRLVGNLLDLSHLESGRFAIHKERKPVAQIIHEAVDQIRSLNNGNGPVINEDIQAGLPEVEADGERLSQVMFNLLTNAVKFGNGEPIMVRAKVKGKELLVQVIDHGIGIPEEDKHHLFERFWRGQNVSTAGGTGLGLYISKQIVEAHGGRIWAGSKVGEGSTFSFTIPLEQGEGDAHEEEDSGY